MTRGGGSSIGLRARIPPLVVFAVGLVLSVGFARVGLGLGEPPTPPWWALLFVFLMAASLAILGAAVALDPRPLPVRRALAGAALAWLLGLSATVVGEAIAGIRGINLWIPVVLAVADGAALLALAATTADVSPEGDLGDPFGRLGAVVVFAIAIVVAAAAAVLIASFGVALWRTAVNGDPFDRIPWAGFVVVLLIPVVTFAIATAGTRRAAGGSFHAQAAANRRNSLILLVALVGVVAATAEVIAVSLTFDPQPALWAAGIAAVAGLAAAGGADRFGAQLLLGSTGAQPADPIRDAVLLDVVGELSLAAGIPAPAVYVVEDASENAFSTGRDPSRAAIAVTRGLLERMDREELQGVIGHELGHVRNLDTRYALYVAVLVGFVAVVTDGFLRLVVEGWHRGAFAWSGDGDNALVAFVTGLLVGLFLLLVALLLRAVAPIFSAMVQASVSREREFLADATSVELTRNARGLERALTEIAADTDSLKAANRGTQHMWFRNPVRSSSDRRSALFATHPTLGARIDRLRALQGLAPLDPDGSTGVATQL